MSYTGAGFAPRPGKPRLVIAQFKHETNTFSPVPTPLERFARAGRQPLSGDAVREEFRGTGSAIGAMIDLAEEAGADIILPVAADAPPSGPVAQEAYDWIASRICDAVRGGCDALLLDLHGAMVSEDYEDGEGELLRRLRAFAPFLPIGVALDMHANVSAAMARYATVIAGYQTYPHLDMAETGLRAARPILAGLGKPAPVLSWGRVPMLPHVMRQSSLDAPNRAIQARCRAIEAEGALAASVFVGFPHADVACAGMSAVVVDASNPQRADAWRNELLAMCWQARHDFVYAPQPLAISMEAAREAARNHAAKPQPASGPVVLLDHYDNCASGGSMDTTTVLEAMLSAGLEQAAAFAIFDPEAVAQMMAAGIGAEVLLDLGGKTAMPSIGLAGKPLRLKGRVRTLSDGHYRLRGPMARGLRASLGPSALFAVGGVDIAVISRHVEPFDLNTLVALGIDPGSLRFLMLKSRVHWRAGLGDLAAAVIECAGTGVCTSDYTTLAFSRVQRPIFPLDPDTRFEPSWE